jgi:type IV pilus assembly protein PilC
MYQYKAYTFDKRIVEGTVDALTEATAEESLLGAGYHRILALKKIRPALSLERLLPGLYGVKKEDVIELFYQLATLVESQMPVVQALWLLSEQSSKAATRDFIRKLGQELTAGTAFSQALEQYPALVPGQYCQVIRASEKSGDLTRGLRMVAGYMEKEAYTIHNIRRMLSYPTFLIVMSGIVIMLVAIVAVPSLMQLFLSLGVDLPLPTRMLVAVAGFIADDRYFILAGVLALAAAVLLLFRWAASRQRFDSIRRTFQEIRQDLIKGKGLSRPMADNPLFPGLLVDMVYIGEKTGTLPSAFAAMADFYEKKLDQRVQRLLSMIEPASIIVVGLIIAFIGIAIITPLYSIYQTMP